MNLGEWELIDLPMEQHDDSLQEHTGIRMAPTLDARRTSGLAPFEESSTELRLGVDPCQ